ncbi:type 4a pilus biogenesis protein PilO [Patescibacteria group bacterium]|nr:type 4a pilus biogenesis protein PilO [Patescibacteria group bacterium]
MDRQTFLKSIFTKKTTDYSFAIIFFFVFSIFIVFAIAPSLTTAFSLKKQEADLEIVDTAYEQKITNITAIQGQIEDSRDSIPLLNQAVSQYPEVNKMVDDVKTIADKNSFAITKANISDVNLRQTQKQIESVELNIEGKTTFTNLQAFMKDLFNQRRLKTINNLVVTQDKQSTNSGQLQVVLTIDGYYL